VLIAPSGSRLGVELAKRYAAVAGKLFLVGNDEALLSDIEKDIGSSTCVVETVRLDMSQGTAIGALAERIGPVDLLVNEAASTVEGSVADVSAETCAANLASTFTGPVHLTMAFLRQKGKLSKIVNIMSTHAAEGQHGCGCSSAGQAALWAFTRSLRRTAGNEVQVTEVMLGARANGPSERSAEVTARRIQEAEQRGREIVVLPGTCKARMLLQAIMPGAL
jgi:short-subunit dehydrogenase